jgi:hypothetical protein
MIWNLLHPLPQFLGFDLIQHRYYFTPPLQLLLSYSGYCVIFDKIRVETVAWVETNSDHDKGKMENHCHQDE